MDKEKIIKALEGFVIRVANGEATSEKETAVLPEAAKLLLDDYNATHVHPLKQQVL